MSRTVRPRMNTDEESSSWRNRSATRLPSPGRTGKVASKKVALVARSEFKARIAPDWGSDRQLQNLRESGREGKGWQRRRKRVSSGLRVCHSRRVDEPQRSAPRTAASSGRRTFNATLRSCLMS